MGVAITLIPMQSEPFQGEKKKKAKEQGSKSSSFQVDLIYLSFFNQIKVKRDCKYNRSFETKTTGMFHSRKKTLKA